jgi:hypothetical protein
MDSQFGIGEEVLRASPKHLKFSDYFVLMQSYPSGLPRKGLTGFSLLITEFSIKHIDDERISEGLKLLILMAISFDYYALSFPPEGEVFAGIPTYNQSITTIKPMIMSAGDYQQTYYKYKDVLSIAPQYSSCYMRKVNKTK